MNNTDPTSFESILAGVAKLRKEKSGADTTGSQSLEIDASKLQQQEPQTSRRINSNQVINAFNQQKPEEWTDSKATDDYNRKRPFRSIRPGKTVLVNTTQKENPLLNHLKSTNWRYVSSTGINMIYYDYLVRGRSVLFLTLTYHKLYVDYISRRMQPLSRNENNILIFIVDDNNSEDTLNDITKLCMFNGFTLLLAFNFEQAAKYIEYLNL
ncbi:ANM_HP_G0066590.mRNA.1.CDS.1 [Saccharomyces cerevisiae]|nr:ANM_HP_G0222830.mRNA.1.CDS.1 [Saccharomyces cerevisiae]CAI5224623.1 ANM_HP_G0066590.mRNA.1.CDS.1 [Saccharomyces cerevisiae]CAI6983464.1 ANM_HP_G0222830.mRNA.1.CDS.1 [Saccharomyces cerevisiae]CAI7029439.1 ANM_HP_G0066590.mRNA.1.CDS.1 [Saccharomyces cerevisiae]